MNTHVKRRFDFIDAMPGAGKTEYFVNKAVAQLKDHGITKNLVYVAPTTKLLAEAYRRIAEKAGREKAKELIVVCNPFELAAELSSLGYQFVRDQPSTALNYLFGLITREKYEATRYRDDYSHDLTEELRPGQVVMTTHESFVRLNRIDQVHGDHRLLKNMTVIFDEARKCVLHSQELRVPRESWAALWKSMVTTRVDDDRETKSKAHLYKVESLASMRSICELHDLPFSRKSLLPDHVKGMLRLFTKYSKAGRGGLYILSSTDPKDADRSADMPDKLSIQVVMRPTSLFENYRQVILTSAFFRDSQMYHFLLKDGHDLVDVLKKTKLDPTLQVIKDRSEKLRKAAVNRLHVATLLRGDYYGSKAAAYRNVLSSNLLDKGMVIPVKLADALGDQVRSDLNLDTVIRTLASPQNPKKWVCKNPEAELQLRKWALPPLWVLLSEAARIFESWAPASIPSRHRSLLTLNVPSKRRWAPSGVRYLRMIRFILSHGDLRLSNRSGSDLHDAEHELDVKLVDARWAKRLKRILFDTDTTDSLFTIPATPHLHGINRYSHLNAFTHLAALNPGPSLVNVYNILIPEYNIDQDHSIENLVQTLYRTSLRDPTCREPVLMVVPYEASAELLASKLRVRKFPNVINEPRFSVFHHVRTERSPEQIARQLRGTQAAVQKFDAGYSDELKKARSRVTAAKTNLKKNPDSVRMKATLERHEQALEALKKRALLNGKEKT